MASACSAWNACQILLVRFLSRWAIARSWSPDSAGGDGGNRCPLSSFHVYLSDRQICILPCPPSIAFYRVCLSHLARLADIREHIFISRLSKWSCGMEGRVFSLPRPSWRFSRYLPCPALLECSLDPIIRYHSALDRRFLTLLCQLPADASIASLVSTCQGWRTSTTCTMVQIDNTGQHITPVLSDFFFFFFLSTACTLLTQVTLHGEAALDRKTVDPASPAISTLGFRMYRTFSTLCNATAFTESLPSV